MVEEMGVMAMVGKVIERMCTHVFWFYLHMVVAVTLLFVVTALTNMQVSLSIGW